MEEDALRELHRGLVKRLPIQRQVEIVRAIHTVVRLGGHREERVLEFLRVCEDGHLRAFEEIESALASRTVSAAVCASHKHAYRVVEV